MSDERDELSGELSHADLSDPLTRSALLAFLRQCSPRTRSTIVRSVEGKASADGVAFIKEHVETIEPDLTTRTVDFVSARTCDFGHLLDEQTRLVATANCCGAHTCSVEGCSLNCIRCGTSLCRRHATTYSDGEVYCGNCKSAKWLKIGLGLTWKSTKWMWNRLMA